MFNFTVSLNQFGAPDALGYRTLGGPLPLTLIKAGKEYLLLDSREETVGRGTSPEGAVESYNDARREMGEVACLRSDFEWLGELYASSEENLDRAQNALVRHQGYIKSCGSCFDKEMAHLASV